MADSVRVRGGRRNVARVTRPDLTTLGDLRASGHQQQTVKAEVRANLLARLASGQPTFPGILGFDETVLPQVERALLAGHDLVLLGERGQGKTRLLRTMVGLLDEWSPVIKDSELGEHPFEPITVTSVRRATELGDDLPVAWRGRDERYAEKLATPDTSVADLIGDVRLGERASVWFGAVIRADNTPILIGAESNIQDGAIGHSDPGAPLTVGARVTVGHQAMLHGCSIGEGSLIGIQAIILNNAKIGKNCLVGAGALITEGKEFPDNSLIIGSPAKAVRTLSPDDIAGMRGNTGNYVERGQFFKANLKRIG